MRHHESLLKTILTGSTEEKKSKMPSFKDVCGLTISKKGLETSSECSIIQGELEGFGKLNPVHRQGIGLMADKVLR